MHAWKRGLICLLLLCAGGHAAADWRIGVPQARLLGAGEFTWFGFSVYSARLFGEQTEQVFEQPFALELTYKRNITRDALVDTSVDEIRRQGSTVDERTLARWAEEMRQSFVDVQPGQRITGVYLPGKGCRFYVDGRLQREIADPAFARAFFSIWLGAGTRSPELREALLGLNASDA